MARMSPAAVRLLATVAGVAVAASLVAACGSTASPDPSAAASSMPSPILVTARPTQTPDIGPTSAPEVTPSGSPGPRPSSTTAPTPRPTPQRDLALESTLPSDFEGMPLDRTSIVLTEELAASAGDAMKPMLDFILGLGLAASDYSEAAARPADRTKGYEFVAYRLAGATQPDILTGYLDALKAIGRADTTGTEQIGGRTVATVTSKAFTGPYAGATEYLYQEGDTIYGVITADKDQAARMLAVLP
jgi:hypothetical protein